MVSRSNRPWLIALLASLVAAFAPLAAQTPAPPTPVRLSFADAVRLASGEVPVVALATLRTTEADARVRQARAALLPSASVGGFWLNRTFNSRSIGISFPGVPELIGPFNNYDAGAGPAREGAGAAARGQEPAGPRAHRRDARARPRPRDTAHAHGFARAVARRSRCIRSAGLGRRRRTRQPARPAGRAGARRGGAPDRVGHSGGASAAHRGRRRLWGERANG